MRPRLKYGDRVRVDAPKSCYHGKTGRARFHFRKQLWSIQLDNDRQGDTTAFLRSELVSSARTGSGEAAGMEQP